MNINEWLKLGFDLGFCSQTVCSTHDGAPTTTLEDEYFDNEDDPPCIHIIRIYKDAQEKIAVEANCGHPIFNFLDQGEKK
jgi:hypothetical protein